MNVAQSEAGRTEELLQLVSFHLGKEEFAVDILKIQEIIRMVDITSIPDSPDFVDGVINLRGKVIPIVDLRKRFELATEERSGNTRIIVMDIMRRIIGFIVDSVSEVIRIPLECVEPPPPMIGGIDSEYIRGVGKIGDRLLILLDINRVLKIPEVEALADDEEMGKEGERKGKETTVKKRKVVEYRGLQGLVEVERTIDEAMERLSGSEPISIEDVRKLVDYIRGILQGNLYQEDLELYGELGELAKFINETKKSLRSFDAAKIAEEDLPAASDQLEGIVESTEDATNQILTATEKMLEDMEKVPRGIEKLTSIRFSKGSKGAALRDEVVEELQSLYMGTSSCLLEVMSACNFQDLTGQRIQKIIGLVQGIESKVMKMILSFNIRRHEKAGVYDEMMVKEKEMLAKLEECELKGPQRKAEAVKQEDVDNLLNELFG